MAEPVAPTARRTLLAALAAPAAAALPIAGEALRDFGAEELNDAIPF